MEDNEDSSSGLQRMSLRERPRADRKLRDELRFLDDFDPEKSNREKRKLRRKIGGGACKTTPYDENGHLRHNGMDVCDCLTSPECPGCWNPCDNCGSRKCGIQCRVNRKFYYESIHFDGKEDLIRNPYFPPK